MKRPAPVLRASDPDEDAFVNAVFRVVFGRCPGPLSVIQLVAERPDLAAQLEADLDRQLAAARARRARRGARA